MGEEAQSSQALSRHPILQEPPHVQLPGSSPNPVLCGFYRDLLHCIGMITNKWGVKSQQGLGVYILQHSFLPSMGQDHFWNEDGLMTQFQTREGQRISLCFAPRQKSERRSEFLWPTKGKRNSSFYGLPRGRGYESETVVKNRQTQTENITFVHCWWGRTNDTATVEKCGVFSK